MAGWQTLTPWRLGKARYSSPPVFNKKQHCYKKWIIFYRSEATIINIKYKSHVTSNANENWTANIYKNNYQESFVVICGQVWKRLSNVNLNQSCPIYKRNSTVFASYKTQKNILNRGPQTAQKYRNHFQILATRKITWSKSHTEGQKFWSNPRTPRLSATFSSVHFCTQATNCSTYALNITLQRTEPSNHDDHALELCPPLLWNVLHLRTV